MYRIDTDFISLSIGIWALVGLEDLVRVLSMRRLGGVELRENVLDSGVKKFRQNTFRLTSRNGKPVDGAALLRVAAAAEQRPKWAQTDLLMNFYQKFTAELVVDIAVALLVQSVVNQVLDYVELVWFLEPSERLKLRAPARLDCHRRIQSDGVRNSVRQSKSDSKMG